MFASTQKRAHRADFEAGLYRLIPLLLLWSVSVSTTAEAWAQEPFVFRATVDRDSITVGDPFILQLSLELPEDTTPEVIPDVGLPETLRVLGAPEASREMVGEGRVRWQQGIQLTSYRPGEVSIDRLALRIITTPGDTLDLSDDPISLLVETVRPDSLTDIVDLKAPVSIDAVIPLWVWVTGVVLVLVIVMYILWRRRRQEVASDEGPTVVVVDWFSEIRRLREAGLIEKGAFNDYYTRLSEAFRRYIEQRISVEAMERATFEVGADLSAAGLSKTRVLEIESFLNEADLVKFAKFEPDAGRANQDCERVLSLMAQIDKDQAPVITAGTEAEGGSE